MKLPVMAPEIRLANYSRKLLPTTDLNSLFKNLFDEVGDHFTLTCEEMSEQEKSEAVSENVDLKAVKEWFQVFVLNDGRYLRRKDIEEEPVRLGQK
jgi:hypothetical protein